MKLLRSACSAALAIGLVLGHAGLASAEPPGSPPGIAADSAAATPTEITVMHATHSQSPSIDPRIGNLPQLSKPPFSSFNTYKLLDRKTLSVERGKPSLYKLPNGRTLQVAVEPVGKIYKVTASISQAKGGSYLKLLEISAPKGEPFFVAGQSYDGGTLVIAITLK